MRKKPWTTDDTQFSLLALPTTAWYLLFAYLPMFGVIIAFIDFRITGGFLRSIVNSEWVGFGNFANIFASRDIWVAIRNTLAYNAVMIAVGTALAITLALIVSELHNKLVAKLYHTILFFPHFLSWVVVSALVWAFLEGTGQPGIDLGIVNVTLHRLGLEGNNWYRDTGFWPPFLVFMSQWKGVGFGMIIYLAAITSQDKSIFEAAVIDGATKMQQIWRITIPMMKPIIILLLILSVGRIFYSDFGLFYQVPLDSLALRDTVTTLDVLVFRMLREAPLGMTQAAAMTQAITACVLTLFVNWIVRRVDPDSAMI